MGKGEEQDRTHKEQEQMDKVKKVTIDLVSNGYIIKVEGHLIGCATGAPLPSRHKRVCPDKPSLQKELAEIFGFRKEGTDHEGPNRK